MYYVVRSELSRKGEDGPDLDELERAVGGWVLQRDVPNLYLEFGLLLLLDDEVPQAAFGKQVLDLLDLVLASHVLLIDCLNELDAAPAECGPASLDRLVVLKVGFLEIEQQERALERDELRQEREVGRVA